MKYIEIKAPAKINIGLNILSRREDGYHNLSTLFYPINDLYDVLTFEESTKFEFVCHTESIPGNDSNLVVKAKNLIERLTGKILPVKINLYKRIPAQAGLGGGSSDAAATLICLNEFFQLGIKTEKILELALELGSDVPFFVKSKPAIGKSRGELLEYVDIEIAEPILIVNPGINISTKEAFQNIAPSYTDFNFTGLIQESKPDYSVLRANLKNDFEDYVFGKYPEIGKIKKTMYDDGALFASLSGSGSSVYGIFSTIDAAANSALKLSDQPFVFISNPQD